MKLNKLFALTIAALAAAPAFAELNPRHHDDFPANRDACDGACFGKG